MVDTRALSGCKSLPGAEIDLDLNQVRLDTRMYGSSDFKSGSFPVEVASLSELLFFFVLFFGL